MENNVLKIKLISFKNTTKSSSSHVLCYVKKLTNLPSSDDSSVILAQTDSSTALVRSIGDTFDWTNSDGNYCQLIFLTSKSKSKVIADVILWYDHLLKLLDDRRYKESETDLLCSTTIRKDYQFEFSVRLLDDQMPVLSETPSTISKVTLNSKLSGRQTVRGHIMKIQQFNHPVHCAICHGFIWGLHHQGFECSQCSLVTHRKCHQQIPFWCRKSLFPEPATSNEGFRLKFDVSHKFKQHEAPFVRALVTRNHGHCNHCGSPIFRNALKCTQCHFIIHEHCKSNVPLMCTLAYDSIAEAIPNTTPPSHIGVRFHPPKATINLREQSRSSSFDFSWLESLSELNVTTNKAVPLPKFSDFAYVGRVGDGAFAQVYCVQHIASKQHMAIKVADGSNEQARQQLEVERQILFRYSQGNPYMIRAHCTFHQGTKLFLVMELVQGGSLYHKIQTTRMNEDDIRFYLAELICVIQYLHSKNIVYRDLKLEHAVVCSEGHIRLVDYGLGRLLKSHNEACHTFCGTYSYMAPEVRCLETSSSEEGYSYPVDFWALGIMFVQMLFGEQIDFASQMFSNGDQSTEQKNLAELLELPRHTSPEACSCIHGLLENDPKKRLGSPDSPHGPIRDHPFFKMGYRIDWQEIEDGVFKPLTKNQYIAPVLSDVSIHRPLSTLLLDRGSHGQADWLEAGRSTCTLAEDEQLKSFDFINQSTWLELTQADA
ncbi:unnamed protein product [Adineta ricciae]|uniref:protein kinase C n=1 Tax=Adineta ricciae TaxID=249248 RepID=A0A814RDF3_ADIRI|nr:unnamed protein product [Adineta ricciae]CAF1612641.1 unnamed protein product [Adineta ricciae]